MINHTQSLLKDLNGGEFQQLAAELLPRVDTKYTTLVHSGAVEGTSKTRKGSPDIWVKKSTLEISLVGITTDNKQGKVQKDLESALDLFSNETSLNKEYVCFLNFEPQLHEIQESETICKRNGISFKLFNNTRIAALLDEKSNHHLRLKFLGIQPDYNVFLTLDEFKDRLTRKSKKLPFSTLFLGRESDIQTILQKVREGTKVIIIDGKPGVGKTRFCLEFVHIMTATKPFQQYGVRFIREIKEGISKAIHSELNAQNKYIIVADDANRLSDLAELFEVIVNPAFMEGSLLILTTRSYNVETVISEVRKKQIDNYQKFTIRRLSNADIDLIIQETPFEIKGKDARKEIVQLSKGNPRMSAIVANVFKAGFEIAGLTHYKLFEEYFEGIFSEISELVDTDKDKILLALIASLRHVNLTDTNSLQQVSKVLGFANERELNASISRLTNAAILDVLPSKTVARIFDDSISEYIVFRYFFDDKHGFLDFKKDVIDHFAHIHAQNIFENLVALTSKGYKSKRFSDVLFNLVMMFRDILMSDVNEEARGQILKWMEQFAYCSPRDSFNVVRDYLVKKGVDNLASSEGLLIINIVNKTIYADGLNILGPAVSLLKSIALNKNKSLDNLKKSASDVLKNAFTYLAPRRTDDKWVYWYYQHQNIILRELEKSLQNKIQNGEEYDLYIELLSQLTSHHFERREADYIDRKKLIMSSGPLYLTKQLEEIRKKGFEHLKTLYLSLPNYPRLRKKILSALHSPFSQRLPFGGCPSKDLMEFDASNIIPHIENFITVEKHYVLLNEISCLLRQIGKVAKNEHAEGLRRRIETTVFKLFQKFYGTFWKWQEPRLKWETVVQKQNEFLYLYATAITEENLDIKLIELSNFQTDASLEKPQMPNMGQMFFELGKNNFILGKKTLDIIGSHTHPLLPYASNILIGIGSSDPDEKRRIASQWLYENNKEKLRMLAWSYSWHNHPNPISEDIHILNALFKLQDEQVDLCLINALQNFQELDLEWVAKSLLYLSYRLSEHSFSELLGRMEPSKDYCEYHYQIYKTHPSIFKEIVFQTIRFESIDPNHLGYHLSNCLKAIYDWEPNAILKYFLDRLEKYKNMLHEKNYGYEALPYDSLNLSFLIGTTYYKDLLQNILLVASKDKEDTYHYIRFLESILGSNRTIFEEDETNEFDPVMIEVFSEWINGTNEQLELVVSILHDIHPWKSWITLVENIVVRTSDRDIWRSLVSPLYLGGYSGTTSAFYQRRLEMIRKYKEISKSLEMQQFLSEAEKTLTKMIEREKDRESEEEMDI